MNNKGFTLIEVLASLVIFTIASLVISRFVGKRFLQFDEE